MLYELRNLCIKNDYFTCGTNSQYEKMFEMAENGSGSHDVALAIWLCSKDAKLEDIEIQVEKIMNK